MVIEEIRYDSHTKKTAGGDSRQVGDVLESRLAGPVDRLAAFIADFLLFFPVLTLIASPFRGDAFEAQVLGDTDKVISLLTAAFGLGAIACVIYQTFFLTVFGATPGKLVLGLRVVNIWTLKRPYALSAFVRSLTWVVEILLLGIPLIAISSNERRRPLHDRMGDTAVIVVGHKRAAGIPGLPEMSMASGFFASVLGIFGVFAAVAMVKLYHEVMSDSRSIATLEKKGTLCKSVGEAQSEWMDANGSKPSRLSVAIAMYGADSLDEDCLKVESDYAIWRDEDKTLAYLGRAFSESDNEQLYDAYLSKVCDRDPDSAACALVSLVRFGALSNVEVSEAEEKAMRVAEETRVENLLSQVSALSPAYLRVWAIRHYMDSHQYMRALELIDQVSPQRQLGYFFVRERTRALWQLDRKDESRLAMRSSIEVLEPNQRVELSRWFCFNETAETGCSDESRLSCGLLSAAVRNTDRLLALPEVAATYIRGESCLHDLNNDELKRLEEKIPHSDGKIYIRALARLNGAETEKGLDLLRQLAFNEKAENPFFYEANARLTEITSQADDLNSIKNRWMRLEPDDEGWRYLGRQLLVKFRQMRAWNETIEVGLRMVETDRFDRDMYRSMVIAAFHSGRRGMAVGFLENLSRLDEAELERQPASSDEFEEVARQLLSEGGEEN